MKDKIHPGEWQNLLISHPNAHILQTSEWGELKTAFGWETGHVIVGNTGAQILFRRLPLGLTAAYIPKGPLFEQANDLSSLPELWDAIDHVCSFRRAIFLKVELDCRDTDYPAFASHFPNFRVSAHPIQPPRTIIVDLHGDEDEILTRMKQKTRYNIHLAEKKGVIVRPWENLDEFHQMMQTTGGRDGFSIHSSDYYHKAYELFYPKGMCELLVAEYEERPLAALMVFAKGNRAWYFYGASANEERNLMPTYLLQWEAMRWAISKGCTEYDLWGIPDVDEETLEARFTERHEGLWGVYRFKRGFGGQHWRTARAMDRVYQPLLYRAYLLRMGRSAEETG